MPRDPKPLPKANHNLMATAVTPRPGPMTKACGGSRANSRSNSLMAQNRPSNHCTFANNSTATLAHSHPLGMAEIWRTEHLCENRVNPGSNYCDAVVIATCKQKARTTNSWASHSCGRRPAGNTFFGRSRAGFFGALLFFGLNLHRAPSPDPTRPHRTCRRNRDCRTGRAKMCRLPHTSTVLS